MLTLGLFISDFKDAVHEGDGDHMLVTWKYLFLFRATGRKNYAVEALMLLSQYHVTLPCNLVKQCNGLASSMYMVSRETT